jgi:hypothetical protein
LQVLRVARANAARLVDEGGVELLAHLAAAAHEALDEGLAGVCGPSAMAAAATHHPAPAAATTNLITNTGVEGAPKEWYYYPQVCIRGYRDEINTVNQTRERSCAAAYLISFTCR